MRFVRRAHLPKRRVGEAGEAQDAWALYSNTKSSTLREQLLGDTKMRSDIELLQNFGAASGTQTTAERRTLYSYKEVEVDDRKAPQPADAKAPKPKKKVAFEKEGTIGVVGLTFAPMDRDKATGLTFKAYYDLLAGFTKLDQLQALVSSTSPYGMAYDDYEFPKEATVVTPLQAQRIPGPILPGSTVPKKTWAQMVAQKQD